MATDRYKDRNHSDSSPYRSVDSHPFEHHRNCQMPKQASERRTSLNAFSKWLAKRSHYCPRQDHAPLLNADSTLNPMSGPGTWSDCGSNPLEPVAFQ